MKNTIATFLLFVAFIFSQCASDKPATAKEETPCVEKQNTSCPCTMQYDPVCGCNKKTYSNACEAECAGITVYTKGVCQ